MNISTASAAELRARLEEIRTAIDTDGADLNAIETEARQIREELEQRAAAQEQRSRILGDVASGALGSPVGEEAPAHPRTMDDIRSSREYEEAYIEALRTGNDREVRALLTTETTGEGLTGYVPVPTALETEIRTAWEEHELFGLVQRSNFRGNIKIGFEFSATGAVVHVEGTDAPVEEQIVLGTVEIKNQMIKKWIRVSDEALEGTTVDTAGYLYREIAYRIVDKAEEILLDTIKAQPAAATTTAVGVPVYNASAITATTIVEALGLLSGAARDLRLVMNRQTYAVFRKAQFDGNFDADIFEGLRDRIIFTDKIKAFSAAGAGEVFAIIGDFRRGAQMNTPNGDGVMLLTDPYTDAEADLVKIVGRLYAGFGIVEDKAFVVLKKQNAG